MSINVVLADVKDYPDLDFQRLGHLFVAASDEFKLPVQQIIRGEDDVTISDGRTIISMSEMTKPNGKGIKAKAAVLFRHIEAMLPAGTYTLQ